MEEQTTGLVETVHGEVANVLNETDNKKLAVGIAIGVVATTTVGYAGKKFLNWIKKKNAVVIMDDVETEEAEEIVVDKPEQS